MFSSKGGFRRLIHDLSKSTFDIQLNQPGDYDWVVQGGLRTLRSQIDPERIIFNRKARKLIMVGGTEEMSTQAKLILARRQLRPSYPRDRLSNLPLRTGGASAYFMLSHLLRLLLRRDVPGCCKGVEENYLPGEFWEM